MKNLIIKLYLELKGSSPKYKQYFFFKIIAVMAPRIEVKLGINIKIMSDFLNDKKKSFNLSKNFSKVF